MRNICMIYMYINLPRFKTFNSFMSDGRTEVNIVTDFTIVIRPDLMQPNWRACIANTLSFYLCFHVSLLLSCRQWSNRFISPPNVSLRYYQCDETFYLYPSFEINFIIYRALTNILNFLTIWIHILALIVRCKYNNFKITLYKYKILLNILVVINDRLIDRPIQMTQFRDFYHIFAESRIVCERNLIENIDFPINK